jgi:hypothetical protein
MNFLKNFNKKDKKLYTKKFLNLANLQSNNENEQLRSFLNFKQDLKNNPKMYEFLNYANTRNSLELGCPLKDAKISCRA